MCNLIIQFWVFEAQLVRSVIINDKHDGKIIFFLLSYCCICVIHFSNMLCFLIHCLCKWIGEPEVLKKTMWCYYISRNANLCLYIILTYSKSNHRPTSFPFRKSLRLCIITTFCLTIHSPFWRIIVVSIYFSFLQYRTVLNLLLND